MIEALEKIKAELMLLGFISLLLTVGMTYISKICIPMKLGYTMLPCIKNHYNAGDTTKKDFCGKKGKVSLISYSGVHQLHIFIFVLAVFHVLYSVIIMALAQAKIAFHLYPFFRPSLKYSFHHTRAFVSSGRFQRHQFQPNTTLHALSRATSVNGASPASAFRLTRAPRVLHTVPC
ncbi:hypothetical protein HYC85_020846 [Camellia sinensis]|uniref:MLO-like protein n=1 Tax=Camellia sinensis TaxID=4442 RepID=A0A7J7GUT7_CAMSI|nr:hypothetical protein HYC85_020846 [Camellia sinensis]